MTDEKRYRVELQLLGDARNVFGYRVERDVGEQLRPLDAIGEAVLVHAAPDSGFGITPSEARGWTADQTQVLTNQFGSGVTRTNVFVPSFRAVYFQSALEVSKSRSLLLVELLGIARAIFYPGFCPVTLGSAQRSVNRESTGMSDEYPVRPPRPVIFP